MCLIVSFICFSPTLFLSFNFFPCFTCPFCIRFACPFCLCFNFFCQSFASSFCLFHLSLLFMLYLFLFSFFICLFFLWFHLPLTSIPTCSISSFRLSHFANILPFIFCMLICLFLRYILAAFFLYISPVIFPMFSRVNMLLYFLYFAYYFSVPYPLHFCVPPVALYIPPVTLCFN